MNWIRNVVVNSNAWFDGNESERRVRITMSLFAVLMAVRIGATRFTPMARIPSSLFDPPWYLRALDRPPSIAVIVILQGIGVVCALGAAVARRPRLMFTIAWLSYLLLAGLRASRGKIIHPDALPLLAMIPLLFAPNDASFRGHRRSGREGAPIRTAIAVVALSYFFTGYHKIAVSGLSWVFSDNMRWVLTSGVRANGVPAPSLGAWIANHALFAQGAAAVTVLVELGAVATLVWSKTRVPFAIGATLLHTGIWWFLNLDYSMWVATVWIVMVDWDSVLGRSRIVAVESPSVQT